MISRYNVYGNGRFGQGIFHCLETFGGGRTVKEIAGQKYQVAAFCLCGRDDLMGYFRKSRL